MTHSLSELPHRIVIAVVAILVFLAAAFAQDSMSGEPMRLPVDATPLIAMTSKGEVRFWVEVADDATERNRGLMFRQEMPDDRGMLFVFEDTRRVAFWMRNTPMPLDLLFLAEDGTVVGILPGEPFSEAPISPQADARFVLELKRGTAQNTGIAVGDRLRHPVIEGIARRN